MDGTVESESIFSPVRASSPSPSIPATPAISSCPSPVRTFSTISSLSASSATSADARSTISTSSRRHGYIRPQGAEFAESAKNRESVMSLGSIAHLQYYFARTGLLEGKGGNSREWKKRTKNPDEVPRLLLTPNARFIDDLMQSPTTEDGFSDAADDDDYDDDYEDEMMLPPTVSTYSVKTHHIPPPPDVIALRRDLVAALNKAKKNIDDLGNQKEAPPEMITPRIRISHDVVSESGDDGPARPTTAHAPQGWHEIQGMRVLDAVTLAIRAAKVYYTAHERPERLASIQSEKEIRQELLNVLEVLKRWAARNFSEGLHDDERSTMLNWMRGARHMLTKEEELEALEANERKGWAWASGDWNGREREREEAFLRSLMDNDADLPSWTPADDTPLPTPILERLRDGRDLIRIHNQAVKKSKRPFGEIQKFHQDVAKPYRRAENLRFWLKAAEIRWETKITMDVTGVVHGGSDEAWGKFDAALLSWCHAVREELMRDWRRPQTPSAAARTTSDNRGEVDSALS